MYDGLNRLTETVFSPTNATATRALYVYNENGKLARVTARYGASTVNTRYYGYDIENRLTSLAVTNGSQEAMLSLDYRYNSAQQITQVIEHALVSGATRVSTNALGPAEGMTTFTIAPVPEPLSTTVSVALATVLLARGLGL